ncbi:zinc finger, GRF-type containing protein [Tanacetum coccineum]
MVVCPCGEDVVVRTSWTNHNPGRRFYACRPMNKSQLEDLLDMTKERADFEEHRANTEETSGNMKQIRDNMEHERANMKHDRENRMRTYLMLS